MASSSCLGAKTATRLRHGFKYASAGNWRQVWEACLTAKSDEEDDLPVPAVNCRWVRCAEGVWSNFPDGRSHGKSARHVARRVCACTSRGPNCPGLLSRDASTFHSATTRHGCSSAQLRMCLALRRHLIRVGRIQARPRSIVGKKEGALSSKSKPVA